MRKKGVWLAFGLYVAAIVAAAVVSCEPFVLGWLALPVAGIALLAAEDVLRILLKRTEESGRAHSPQRPVTEDDLFPPAANDRINYPIG